MPSYCPFYLVTYHRFVHLYSYHTFYFLNVRLWDNFKTLKNFVISRKRIILKKECITMILRLASTKTCRTRLDLMKKRVSFSIERNCIQNAPDIYCSFPLSGRWQFTPPSHFIEIKQSICSYFSVYVLFCPCLYFSYFASFETWRKNIENVSEFASIYWVVLILADTRIRSEIWPP